jgi:thiol-disulfide isomerase/thioredoxin
VVTIARAQDAVAQAVPSTAGTAGMVRSVANAPAPRYVAYGFAPGERVADVKFKDADGKSGVLSALAGTSATDHGVVIVMRDSGCPVSQRYSPRLAELERAYGPQGIRFVYVDVTPYSRADAKSDAKKYGLTGRVVLDTARLLVHALRATSTTEVFVLDTRGTIRYRGAVDDQYGITFHRNVVTKPWLRSALDRVIAGKDVAVPSTDASGCMFDADMDAPGASRSVTYHNRISRLIQTKCEGCHRTDGLAPMPLERYEDVAARSRVIVDQVTSHRMPPWNANKAVGTWTNDVSLSDRDLADLVGWFKAGAPKGKKQEAPLPRAYAPHWEMGKPDAIVQIPDTFHIPAQGVVEYKYAFVKTNFDTDKWITAIEIHPTAPTVVHHVLVFIEEPGRKAGNDPTRKPTDPPPAGGINGFFAATAPGSPATVYPLGAAKKLPKGAWLKFQIHYQPNGIDVADQTQMGFRFADDSSVASGNLLEVETRSAANNRFAIPPNDPNYQVDAATVFRRSGTLISLFPHTHLRGKSWKIELMGVDSSRTLLLDVPRYDFNWQTFYQFKYPVHVDSGMRLLTTAWYDNSSRNPSNPDPTKTVRFGEQTFEEMMIGYFDWIPDPLPRAPTVPPANAPAVPKPAPIRPSAPARR